jgi:uncharacterized protein (TIGR02246 family)
MLMSRQKRIAVSIRLTLDYWVLVIVLSVSGLSLLTAGADTSGKNPDERQLLSKMVESLVSAWNKNDADTMAKFFLPDAVLVTPTGAVVRSRSAIKKRIIDERQGKLKDSTLTHAVESVSFPNNNTAVVKGKYQVQGMKLLGMEKSPEGSFTFRQTKRQGRWMIAKAEVLRKKDE